MKMKKAKKLKQEEKLQEEVEQVQKDPEIKSQAVFELRLTKFELLHLRDLMSVLLPPDGSQTISKALAAVEDRTLIDSLLWNKVSSACVDAGLPIDAAAPDYIVAPIAPPPMGIFQINQDLQDEKRASVGFLPEEDGE